MYKDNNNNNDDNTMVFKIILQVLHPPSVSLKILS